MANNSILTYRDFLNSTKELREKAAAAREKKAAEDITFKGATDPNEVGTVTTPSCGDGSNRSLLNLPKNSTNLGPGTIDSNLFKVTKPSGSCEGQCETAEDGSAKDRSVNSFTAPMSKLSGAVEALRNCGNAPQQKQAAEEQDNSLVNALNDADTIRKLAFIGQTALASEAGQRAVANTIAKEAGYNEAQNILHEASILLAKEAAFNEAYNNPQNIDADMYMDKVAATHNAWLDQFQTEFEKLAYAQGAADGENAADAIQGGVDPGDAMDQVTEEDVIQRLQELVQQGAITEEQAQQVLQLAASDLEDGVLSPDEAAAILEQAVQSGEISEEEAAQIAELYGQQAADDEAGYPEEGDMEVQASVNGAFNAMNAIFG